MSAGSGTELTTRSHSRRCSGPVGSRCRSGSVPDARTQSWPSFAVGATGRWRTATMRPSRASMAVTCVPVQISFSADAAVMRSAIRREMRPAPFGG